MESYKEALLDILDRLTCCHCKMTFTYPVTLACRHSVCLDCAEKIGSKNKEGLCRFRCPKCGMESVTEALLYIFNLGLWGVVAAVREHTASLGKGQSTLEVCSQGDSGVGYLRSEYSIVSSCSITSMLPPPVMASKRELFEKMFLPTDGRESEELSQRPSGSSDCSAREQRSEDEASALRSLLDSGRYSSGGLCEPKLPEQSAPGSTRAHIMDSLTQRMTDGTQGYVYKTRRYTRALLAVLDRVTCPHCKEIFTLPVTLDCGHIVCLACARKTGSKNKAGQRCCCCPKCGVKSVTEDLGFRVNWTLVEMAAAVCGDAASVGKGRPTIEGCSGVASESGMEVLRSECSFASSCSIGSMLPPPAMASKRELFDRMSLVTDGLESEDELSQRPSGSSDCSENKQRSEDQTSARGSLSGSGRYLFGGPFKAKLRKQNALASFRAHSLHSIRDMIYHGRQESVYGTGWYKQAFRVVMDRLICPRCKGIFTNPVVLDCGHSVCWDCAEKIESKNKEGQRCCCCPKCGVESVTEYFFSRVYRTMLYVAAVSRRHAASLGKGRSTRKSAVMGTVG